MKNIILKELSESLALHLSKMSRPGATIHLKKKGKSILVTIKDDKPFLSHILFSIGKFDMSINVEIGWSEDGKLEPWNLADLRCLDWHGKAKELKSYLIDVSLLSHGNAKPFFLQDAIDHLAQGLCLPEEGLEKIMKKDIDSILEIVFADIENFVMPYFESVARAKIKK